MYQLKINSKQKRFDVSKDLYGLFIEDINRAGDGGLYAELIRNRAFDEGVIPNGCTYNKESKTITSPTGWDTPFDCYEGEQIVAWKNEKNAQMRLISTDTLNDNRKRALEVQFHGGYITNEGFRGICLEKGAGYRFYMFAKAERNTCVSVKLTSNANDTYAEKAFEIGTEYNKYECELVSCASDIDARLALSSDDDCSIIFGFVSLFPKDTYMSRENGLRKKLVDRLIALKPAFLRFPGGCIVEGFTEETAFKFADTIGPVWERKPHWNLWGYMTSNGLGYHEYLQFCEDMGMDAMYVFNCGMTCQARHPNYMDDAGIEAFYQDTVHAIEYATAPADTEWGRKRAENGHPEPFTVLKYLEIGNENWGEEYHKRYKFFYERLKKQYPQFVYISTADTEKQGLPTEYVDIHHYNDPVEFTKMSSMFDDMERDGVNLYCGEYAATFGCEPGSLRGALGEAAFLTGVERNQDKITMTSYAPLFQNVAYKAWEPDMIMFDNHRDYGIPSYYMQQMFARNRGDYVCECECASEATQLTEHGHFTDEACNVFEGNVYSAEYVATDSFRIKFWDSGVVGEKQYHYDWIVENGISKVLRYHFWYVDTVCEKVNLELPKETFRVCIETEDGRFKIFLNDKLVHDVTLRKITDIYSACTVDTESREMIAKVVNFSEKTVPLRLDADCAFGEAATLISMAGDSYEDTNSFEEPERIIPKEQRIHILDKTVTLQPRSVNVIRLGMRN